MLVVCERWVGDGDRLLHINQKVLLTIAALLSHSGRAAQPWVTEGPKPSFCWLSIRHLVPNWLQLQLKLTRAVCSTWLYFYLMPTCFLWAYASATITKFNHVHRSRWYSDIFDWMHLFRCSSAYLHRCISWLTARSRVNMLQDWVNEQSAHQWSRRPGFNPRSSHTKDSKKKKKYLMPPC